MPEIKRNFTKGKMNKDLDERLVPPGEYRNAVNVQVSTSDESNVGTVQNVLGNITGCTYANPNDNPVLDGSSTVGSISDEKNDSLYWLVAGSSFELLNLPLAPGNTASFKDLIMRTNSATASGCEPVFVDKYGFCTGISPSTWNPVPTDTIVLDDPSLYSSITPGMYATGFIASGVTSAPSVIWGPTLVSGVGSISVIPINYQSRSDLNPTTVTPPDICIGDCGGLNTNMYIRGFWDGTAYTNVQYDASISSTQTNLPNDGESQLWVAESDMPVNHNITPGSTINQVAAQNYHAFNNLSPVINGGANLTIHKIILGTVQDNNGNNINAWIMDVGVSTTNPVSYFNKQLNTCWSTVISGAGVKYGCAWYTGIWQKHALILAGVQDGEAYPFYEIECNIQPADIIVNTGTPNNIIDVQTNSFQWLNEVYETLFDDSSGIPVLTGAQLSIDNAQGAGFNFPSNSCIDPDSVIDPAYGFSTVTPISYSNTYEIVDCADLNNGTITNHNATAQNTSSYPLYFETAAQYAIQAVYLNDTVNISNVQTICFQSDRILNFEPDRLITGINIVDDLLLWTDHFSEPKKINIPRSVQGTDALGDTHTAVVNASTGLSLSNYKPIREEHITVIRKSPKSSLNLELKTGRDPFLNYTGSTNTVVNGSSVLPSIISSSNPTVQDDFSTLQIGDTVRFIIEQDYDGNVNFNLAWQFGDYLLLKEFTNGVSDPIPLANWTIRGVIKKWNSENFDTNNGNVQLEIQVVGLKGTPSQPDASNPSVPLSYTVDLEDKNDKLFENKFPRFSYRYKYEDGEYSTFAPWSEVAFIAGNFDYDPKKGWNTGMINNIKSINVKNFRPDQWGLPIGQDVISVDILYKEDSSPSVYIVETISPTDIAQNLGGNLPWYLDEYEIKSETIKSLVSSNQLLRPWDNVPTKALAQEVSGNRIVYANYEQGYDLKVGGNKYKPSFKNYLSSWGQPILGAAQKSIKSLRDYKLGVVFTDKYGRETPVMISESGGFKVEKINSDKANRLAVSLDGDMPDQMAFFKFYIKETSTEYYNLAMDRWYAAEDGNIWLAFPSSDRNKVDIETSLYFKKGDDDSALENTTRYKVLALENEAPEFIKTRTIRIGSVTHDPSSLIASSGTYAQVFGNVTDQLEEAPSVGGVSFTLNYEAGRFSGTSLSRMEDITEDLYVQFVSSSDYSSKYKISEITSDRDNSTALVVGNPNEYYITLDTNIKDDINFIFDNPGSPTLIKDNIKIQFTKAVIENKPKFDGRFFAKIENDGKIKTQITDDSIGVNYIEKASKMVYVLEADDLLQVRSRQAVLDGSGNGGNYVTDSMNNLVSDQDENPSGLNWNWYHCRQSYFGELEDPAGATSYNPGSLRSIPAGRDNPGVWFIDRATRKYTQNNPGSVDQLSWQSANNMNDFVPDCNIIGPNPSGNNCGTNIHTPTWQTGPGIYNGTSYSSVGLGFGGFGHFAYDKLTGYYSSGVGDYYINNSTRTLGGFFGIGGSNPDHNDSVTSNFVDRLQSGFSFKWEDDPTETVYTITNQTTIANHVRFGRWDDGYYNHGKLLIGAESSYSRLWNFAVNPSMSGWDPSAPINTFMTNGLTLGDGVFYIGKVAANAAVGDTTISLTDTSNIEVGMSVKYNVGGVSFPLLTKVVSINTTANTVTIDGAGVTGGQLDAGKDVEFGYTIRVLYEYVYGVTSTAKQDNYIIVDGNFTECSNGNNLKPTFFLKKGMMLEDYNLDSSANDPTYRNVIIKDIVPDGSNWKITLTGYFTPLHYPINDFDSVAWGIGERIRFRQVAMNGASKFTEDNTDLSLPFGSSGGIGAVGYKMIMVEPIDEYSDGGNLPPNPFVWETEPKDSTELDIYYEISENNPKELNVSTINTVIPVGSKIENISGEGGFNSDLVNGDVSVTYNTYASGDEIAVSSELWIGPGNYVDANGVVVQPLGVGSILQVTKPSGVMFDIEISSFTILPLGAFGGSGAREFKLKPSLHNSNYFLNWHNCYSFGNGVESNRIKDNFNLPFIANGVKVSTTLDKEYKKEYREHGLIYSGIYNSTSGVNNLNQFIQAEKITKDLNSIYGSIQKLHAGWGQGGDLIALCEDRILKILANKDALFNADGDTNVVSTNAVLGTAIPYSGKFGISKNPESFASESYRAYFTDKVRGTVMRLSMDGLTSISDAGMKDWFRKNLKLTNENNSLIGSYDDRKREYNITTRSQTVTYREDVKGWVSFKSFIPENGLSCANEYYTFDDGNLFRHHVESVDRNTFYNVFDPSEITIIMNDAPDVIKTFHTLNYEGSQSKVDAILSSSGIQDNYDIWDASSWDGTISNGIPNYSSATSVVADGDYYNLSPGGVAGWYVQTIQTDKEEGSLNEFIEKEGKWFNYIKGK